MRLFHGAADTPARRREVDLGRRPDGRELWLDVWTPQSADGPWPVALLVHGAAPDALGLPFRTSALFAGWARALASTGVATLAFDHTLGWRAFRLDQAAAEVEAVLRWLHRNGPTLGLDASRLSAVASSAGALLAADLTLRPGEPRVGRMALLSPLARAPDDAEAAAPARTRMDLAANARLIASTGVRLLIVRAGADEPSRLQALDAATAALIAAEADLTVIDAPGAPHAFEAARSGADTDAAVDAVVGLASWR